MESRRLTSEFIRIREDSIKRLYVLLRNLKERIGEYNYLSTSTGNMNWPKRGVYFFFEQGEYRSKKDELRVVRVGTHAINQNSKSTLWGRLREHRGTFSGRYIGGGNHRGSVFRLHIGAAILRKNSWENDYPAWGHGQTAPTHIKLKEYTIEKMVSEKIGQMPFLWLKVDDAPGRNSIRSYLERNAIALLSNFMLESPSIIDPPSRLWLGNWAKNDYISGSGLWNVDFVTVRYVDESFIDILELKIDEM